MDEIDKGLIPGAFLTVEGGAAVEMQIWVDSLGYINFTTWSGFKGDKRKRFWVNPMKGDIIPGERPKYGGK